MMTNNSRIGWIDNWKGFMLLIVCLGHYKVPIPNMFFLTSVHVASFFFLSGLLFDMNKNRDFNVFFRKKVLNLLVPYISLSLFFLSLEPHIYNINLPLSVGPHYVIGNISTLSWILNPSDSLTLLFLHVEDIFVEGVSSTTTSPLWFLWALFVVDIILWIILRIASNRIWVAWVTLLLMYVGWKFNDLQIYLPLNINSIISAAAISFWGYLCQTASKHVQKLNILYAIPVAMLLFFLYWLGLNNNGTIDLHFNNLGSHFFMYGLIICCGLGFYMLVFNYLDRFIGGGKMHYAMSWLAKNSIVILAVHYWSMRVFKAVCYYMGEGDNQYILYGLICFGCITCAIAVPLFNRYLPTFVGRKKKLK